MYQKLSNRLKEQAFLFHKPVGIPLFTCPAKCIPTLEHNGPNVNRVINLATGHWASAQHALTLVPFALIQCSPGPVSGQSASYHWTK